MTKTAIQLKLDPNKLESKFKLLGGGRWMSGTRD